MAYDVLSYKMPKIVHEICLEQEFYEVEVTEQDNDRIKELVMALKYCVNAIAEYEKDPTDLSLRPWLLGAMDHAKKILENKDD